MVSLVLFSIYPLTDNHRERSFLADIENPLSLQYPDYLTLKHNINETSGINKPVTGNKGISNDWYSDAKNKIRQEEYNITYSDEADAFQSSNRVNNIRFIYHNNGFTAKTIQTKLPHFDVNDRILREEDKEYKIVEDWRVDMRIDEAGIENPKVKSEGLRVSGNTAWTECNNFRIDYTNTEKGMRQDFIVKKKPSCEGDLNLLMNVSTDLKMNISRDAVTFRSQKDGTDIMRYTSLKAWDATGKMLVAYFEERSSKQFAIRVIDKNAQYPVSVDPLSMTPDWITVCDQQWSRYGDGVSAGDINGDGFDDVVVGAPAYEPGGAVFLYLGSAIGPSIIPDQVLYGEDIGFGNRVDCKGDVNNDGYNDLIVGDPFWGGGRILIYHGSPTGLPDSANMDARSFWSGGNNFGYTVTSAEVNGDGYSDVIASISNEVYPPSLNVIAYVFFGSSAGMNWTPGWLATVPLNTYDVSICNVSNAGDVNNDGFEEVIVGAYNSNLALIYLGSPQRQMLDPADFILTDSANGFGHSVSKAGDVNSDGYGDIVVGSLGGSAFAFYGSQNGPSMIPDWTHSGDYCYGNVVNSAGDFNDDGFDDVVISNCNELGFHLFFGGSTGLNRSPFLLISPVYNFSSGDVNGDGFNDVLSSREPRAYAFYGTQDRLDTLYFPKRDTLVFYPPQEVCLTVFAKSQFGLPVSGLLVEFIVTGMNSGSGAGISDSNGTVTFCYFGTHLSNPDTIIASAEGKRDTMFVTLDVPLEVELSLFSFALTDNNVNLYWSTSSEINNSGFYIERYSKENVWIKLGFINGNGTISKSVSYSFTDRNLSTGNYKYRLKQIDFNGNFNYYELAGEISIGIPDKYNLLQNYPNPFNPVTTINYDLPKEGIVTIIVYDILGRELKTLINELKTAGYHKIIFNADDLASGVYFYRMIAGDFISVKKLVVFK